MTCFIVNPGIEFSEEGLLISFIERSWECDRLDDTLTEDIKVNIRKYTHREY